MSDGLMEQRPHPSNEFEFQELMELVDAELRAEKIPIARRALSAQSKLAVLLKELFVHPVPLRDPREGVYRGHDLTIRVEQWFDARYGRRQEESFSPGSIVLLLRGDTWLLELPRLIGAWEIIASRMLVSDEGGPVTPGAPPSRYNVVESIQELPPGFKDSLTDDELHYIKDRAI